MNPETDEPRVDVIVRTLGEKKRADSLARALNSIRNQVGVEARALVVVNGDRFDPDLVAELEQTRDIKFDQIDEASLVASRSRGLHLVEAPLFAFLDDDDELISDSLVGPVTWLAEHPEDDAVITLIDMSSRGDARSPGHGDIAVCPLNSLLESCWLHPGSGFFRASEKMKKIANVERSHMEWTTIALRLVMRSARLHFMNTATVVYHDTDASLSKNAAHQDAELAVMREVMADKSIDRATRRRARAKYLNTLHTLSAAYKSQGRRGQAWQMHLRSLCSEAFFKYVLYTRKLLR